MLRPAWMSLTKRWFSRPSATRRSARSLMHAVRYASLGQITAALFEVGGAYRRVMWPRRQADRARPGASASVVDRLQIGQPAGPGRGQGGGLGARDPIVERVVG